MYQFHSPLLPQDTINFLWFLSSLLFLIEMGVWGITLTYNTIISKKDPNIMANRDYMKYCKKFNENWIDDLRSEFGRKMLHLFTSSIIFIFWTIGTFLKSFGILKSIGLDLYSFSYWWIITIGFAFVFMFQIADLARLNKFYMLPNWAKKWYLSMRQDELDTFIGSTPLVLSFVPFIFSPFPIFASVALITTVADAIACLIGKKFGSHNLKKDSNKTLEGFLAGGLSSFVIVIFIMIIYNNYILISSVKILLMALTSMLIFLLIDFFTKNISDNILNPIFTGLAMWIIFII
jgi:dolichol kinase